MSELAIVSSHYSTIVDFLKSFELGSEPEDFLANSLDSLNRDKIERVIHKIDSQKYFNAKPINYFHQNIEDANKLLIIVIYELNNEQFAIQYTMDKNPVENPIYELEIRK